VTKDRKEYGEPVYQRARRRSGTPEAWERAERNTNQNGEGQGIGDRAESEENQEGETVVLVERSTEG